MATIEARLLLTALLVLLAAGGAFAQADRAAVRPIRVTVRDKVLHRIDPRLFGQFMERPSWGEIGPEGALVPGTNRLQPAAREMIRRMRIPIVRFPGGTDADYTDWLDMIDNVPGRSPARPVTVGHKGHKVTNRFGYDEFLQLCEELEMKPILVVNFRRGLLGEGGVEDGAAHAARLAAYCNAPVDAELPERLGAWAKLRAANGRRKPYGVGCFQIGNETWGFAGKVSPDRYVRAVRAYIDALRAVDRDMQIIVDGCPAKLAGRVHKELGRRIDYFAVHHYQPWAMREAFRGEKRVDVASLSPRDIWYAWVTVPAVDADGQCVFEKPELDQARRLGYKVAMTEWNWNGWWADGARAAARLNSALAKGLGAAGMLHAIMREGDLIALATQSMLIGNSWSIHAIHADSTARTPPYMMPSGQVTSLYCRHHGSRRLAIDLADVPRYDQPYRLAGIRAAKGAAQVDILATRSEEALFLHAINRHFDATLRVRVDSSALSAKPGRKGTHHVLTGRLPDRLGRDEEPPAAHVLQQELPIRDGIFEVDLPPRTVSVVEVPLG